MSKPNTDNSGRIVRQNSQNPTPRAAAEASDAKTQAPATIEDLLPRYEKDFARVLPKHLTPERFMRLALSALRTTPELSRCTAASFLSCLLQCAQMGLEPNTAMDLAYLIPYENKKRSKAESERQGRPVKWLDCTLQVGYKGYLQLARNAGVHIQAYAVREGDDFEYEYGLNPTLRHKPSKAPNRSKKPFTHAYAVAKSSDFADMPLFVVLPSEDVLARKALNRGSRSDSSPWNSAVGEERMWQKSAVRALVAWVPVSSENLARAEAQHLARAAALDDASDGSRSLMSAVDTGVIDTLQSHGVAFPQDEPENDGEHETGDTAIDTTAEPASAAPALPESTKDIATVTLEEAVRGDQAQLQLNEKPKN